MKIDKIEIFGQEIPIYRKDDNIRFYEMEHAKMYVPPFQCEFRLQGIINDNTPSFDVLNPFKVIELEVKFLELFSDKKLVYQMPAHQFFRLVVDKNLDRYIVDMIFEEFHKNAIKILNLG